MLDSCFLIHLERVHHGFDQFVVVYLAVLVLVQVVELHQVLRLLLDAEDVDARVDEEERS